MKCPLTPKEKSMLALLTKEAVESHCGVCETEDDDLADEECTGNTQRSFMLILYTKLIMAPTTL